MHYRLLSLPRHVLPSTSKCPSSCTPVVLGIETSCDDTGVAIATADRRILANCVISQQATTNKLGGVIPTYANTVHRKNLPLAVHRAISDSGLDWRAIDYIAVTTRPGLAICLREGVKVAQELAERFSKPLIPVHHMQAHALTVRLVKPEVEFPFLTFLMSGGHCLLVRVKDPQNFAILGKHTGMSPGELCDKIARRLNLRHLPGFEGFSGGAAIEKLAVEGDSLRFKLASVGGVKTANTTLGSFYTSTLRRIADAEKQNKVRFGHIPDLPDFCASFQHGVFARLSRRLHAAMEFLARTHPGDPRTLVLSGGVASNTYIREGLAWVAAKYGYATYSPPPHLCTDNGLMIAWNAVELLESGFCPVQFRDLDVEYDVHPIVPIGDDISDRVSHVLGAGKFERDINKKDFARYFVRHRKPGDSLLK